MTIQLPEELDGPLHAGVLGGRFATADELVAEAVREYLGHARPGAARTSSEDAEAPDRPIWELIEEENRAIPPETWDVLPTDLSEQHDHYVYGTPKRID